MQSSDQPAMVGHAQADSRGSENHVEGRRASPQAIYCDPLIIR